MEFTKSDLLGALLSAAQKDDKPIPQAKAVAMLREVGARYKSMYAGNRFKVGDWVTPSADSSLKGNGIPHLVVAVHHDPEHRFVDEPGNPKEGNWPDIRVINVCHDGEHVLAYWGESAEYIPFVVDEKIN